MNKRNLNINATAFVIPNKARSMGDFSSLNEINHTHDYLSEIAKLNNIKLVDTDKIVQIWFYSEEVGCDNMADHGFTGDLGNGISASVRVPNLEWVPLKLLQSMKEDHRIVLSVPGIWYTSHKDFKLHRDDSTVGLTVHISMICRQSGSRYARFGNFEELVNLVCK